MNDVAEQQYQLCRQAYQAENAGRVKSAADDYRRAIFLDKNNPTPYLYLGFALKKLNHNELATQVYSLAADIDSLTIGAWRNPEISKDIKLRSQDADESIRFHFTQLHKQAVAEYQLTHPAASLDRIYDAVWCATHDQPFTYRNAQQRPHLFYVEELDPVPVFDPGLQTWATALENAYEEIREEYLQLASISNAKAMPYIESDSSALDESWQPLIGSTNWASFHLYKNDAKNSELIAQLPKTCEVLNQVPLLKTYNQPREVLFSLLKGKQHIPPHYGLANTDMTVHLPLITSSEAGIKVAGEVYQWQEGKSFLFDDSFLHESWNGFAESRVNLLFAAWHPDLSLDEQNAISASFESREAWNRSRSI